ncbi:MAG: amidohydrolase family protein [Acidimicrobiales bacterium]|nr:amidohydrolase family protein [Acidimicrobiales bacterium]
MLDLVIRSGVLYDGTGGPARVADIGVRGGVIDVIAAPGGITEPARRRIDADGRAILPGFVDVHTHHDAQVFWDPACTPSSHHGVTTVVGGNCGFSLAPLSHVDPGYLMRMMARVEGIPLQVLESAVPWSWSSTEDYLAQVAAQHPVINIGFMVGHSALRRAVMGGDGVDGRPSGEQLESMQELLRRGVAAGAIGFSSSWGAGHFDGEGSPVPSRAADRAELVSLCRAVKGTAASQVEFIAGPGDVGAESGDEVMIAMAEAAGVPLNWNILMFRSSDLGESLQRLALSDQAADSAAPRSPRCRIRVRWRSA